jgi:hypothetical protein
MILLVLASRYGSHEQPAWYKRYVMSPTSLVRLITSSNLGSGIWRQKKAALVGAAFVMG